jgi:hypothetical protein
LKKFSASTGTLPTRIILESLPMNVLYLANVHFIKSLSYLPNSPIKKPQYLKKGKSNDDQYSTVEILQNMEKEGQCEID